MDKIGKRKSIKIDRKEEKIFVFNFSVISVFRNDLLENLGRN